MAITASLAVANIAQAQFGINPAQDTSSSAREETKYWKVGLRVSAIGGPCQGLYSTVPVPAEWPEQAVRIVDEEISRSVAKVAYRMVEDGARQMLVSIPSLRSGETAEALVTFEVRRTAIEVPNDPLTLQIPKRIPRDVRRHLGPSPYIESRHPKIRELAQALTSPDAPAWQQVEAIYDGVRERVEYRNGKLKGALAALEDGNGDCEELTSLFIAVCRSQGIPARTVWVPDHCYPEFYLEDTDGQGHWFPCQAAGSRAFGHMPDLRPILQKGDNFKVPEKRERQRYVSEFLTGSARRGSGKPEVHFIRQTVPTPPQLNAGGQP